MISFVNTKKTVGTGGNSQEAPALIALSDLGTGLTTFYDLFRDVPEMNEPFNFQPRQPSQQNRCDINQCRSLSLRY